MKNINKLLFGLIASWALLATIFGFYDLEISKHATIYKNVEIFDFGNNYGNHLDDSLLYVSITILVGSLFNDIKMQRKIGIIMILYSVVYLESINILYNGDGLVVPYMIILFLITFYIITYNKNWRNYLSIAVSIILLYFFTNVIVDVMKIEWGRVRYNDLSSESEFTAWYIINGPDPENDSFPSGHTASAFTFLPLIILITNKKISNKFKIMLVFSVLSFGLYVAIGRVVIGKHYASDVLFSAGICSILTIVFYKLFNKLDLKTNLNNFELNNAISEIIYSDLTNQWLGCYYNKKGGKFWKWSNSYEEALNFSPTI